MPAPLAGLAVIVVGLAAPLCMAVSPAYAAATSLYLSPASANVTVNTTFNVGVRINAGESVNAVEANLSYNQSQLQYVGMSDAGSAFGINASSNGGGGSVTINRGQVGGVSGDKLVATVTFKALTSNVTSGVSFAGSSQALRNSDSSNVLGSTSGGSYALKAAAVAKPPGGTPASPTDKTPAPTPASPTPATPTTETPVTSEASPTPQTADTPSSTPSTTAIDDSRSVSKAAIYGLSGLAVLVIGVAVAVVVLKRHHSPAVLPGAYVGDSHATIFGPSQPVHPVTPATPTAPAASVISPTNSTSADAAVPSAPVGNPTTVSGDSASVESPTTQVQPTSVVTPQSGQTSVEPPPDKPVGTAPGT